MTPKKTLAMSAGELDRTMERLTDEIMANHTNQDELILVGIRTTAASGGTAPRASRLRVST